jgi:hypothetical protein
MQAAKQCAPDCRAAAGLALCSPGEIYECCRRETYWCPASRRSSIPLIPLNKQHLDNDPWQTGGVNSPNHNQEAEKKLISLLT